MEDTTPWTRRSFLAMSGTAAGALALASAACSSDDAEESVPDTAGAPEDDDAAAAETDEHGVPTVTAIAGWIGQVVDQGIRRPGYRANAWTEDFCEDLFRRFGLENVRREPVTATRWEPIDWSLEVTPQGGDAVVLDCFPLPYTAPAEGLEAEVAAYDPDDPDRVNGKASLLDVSLIGLPADSLATAGSAPDDVSGRIVDSQGTLPGATHIVPTSAEFPDSMEPLIEAGAVAFIGSLKNYPGDSHNYYVSYPADDRPIPGVWINGPDGDWLTARMAEGPVRMRLTVTSTSQEIETYNIVGELAGADDELVIIGSHHDGPWASAVEDASGISLVLAQASYWAAQPVEARPHRLVFLLQAAHMDSAAGHAAFLTDHRGELDDVVLEIHLEHVAREITVEDGELRPTGLPVPRWFFTSRIPQLESAVIDALRAEGLDRSIVLAPDAIGSQPPTDGGFFHTEGVPVAQFLAAPFYLFDRMDTLDKVDEDSLVPLTRATIRIVESTHGTSAAEMRASDQGT